MLIKITCVATTHALRTFFGDVISQSELTLILLIFFSVARNGISQSRKSSRASVYYSFDETSDLPEENTTASAVNKTESKVQMKAVDQRFVHSSIFNLFVSRSEYQTSE